MVDMPGNTFWEKWHTKEAKVEAEMKEARPQIPRSGIPDPGEVALYAQYVARADAWQEARIFLLNMTDENFKRREVGFIDEKP